MFENRQFKIADTPRSRSGKQKDIFRSFQQCELVAGLQKIFRRRSRFPIIEASEQDHRDTMFFRQCLEKSDDMRHFVFSGSKVRLVLCPHLPDIEDGKIKGRVVVIRLESVAELLRASSRLLSPKRSFARELRHGSIVIVHVSDTKKRHPGERGSRHPRRGHEPGMEECGALGIGDHVEREILRRAMIEIERRQRVEFAFLESADHAVKCLESGGDHVLSFRLWSVGPD